VTFVIDSRKQQLVGNPDHDGEFTIGMDQQSLSE
jgi:hypothetical protein